MQLTLKNYSLAEIMHVCACLHVEARAESGEVLLLGLHHCCLGNLLQLHLNDYGQLLQPQPSL